MYDLNKAPDYLSNWTSKLATAKATKTKLMNIIKDRTKYNKDYAASEADTLEERLKTFKI